MQNSGVYEMTRPLILVTCWRRYLPTFLGGRTLLDTLDPAYADRVAEAGGRPMLVSRPSTDVQQSIVELIELADGLVLTGGGDVDPARYGAVAINVADMDPGADAFEIGLLRAARHEAVLVSGSRLWSAFARETIAVNTIHHHQIADAGDLRVTALAPGGVIEAVEPDPGWPCVGVQWHPEKMDEPEQRVLFAQLVADASEYAAVPTLAAAGSTLAAVVPTLAAAGSGPA